MDGEPGSSRRWFLPAQARVVLIVGCIVMSSCVFAPIGTRRVETPLPAKEAPPAMVPRKYGSATVADPATQPGFAPPAWGQQGSATTPVIGNGQPLK